MIRRYMTRLMLAGGAALAMLALALHRRGKRQHRPKAIENFAGCPSKAENPEVSICITGHIKSGHFQMGSKDRSHHQSDDAFGRSQPGR